MKKIESLMKVEEESTIPYGKSNCLQWNTGYIDIIHDSIDFTIVPEQLIVTDFAYLSFNLDCFDFKITDFHSILTQHSVKLNSETEDCFVRYTDAAIDLDNAKEKLLLCTLDVYREVERLRLKRRTIQQ